MTRVALLVNANNPQATKRYIDETNTAATGLGLHVQPVEVRLYSREPLEAGALPFSDGTDGDNPTSSTHGVLIPH